MTAGKNISPEEMAEKLKSMPLCPVEYRFWGAEFLDGFSYAAINFAEATVGLLTLGLYYPSWTYNLDPIVWKIFRKDRKK